MSLPVVAIVGRPNVGKSSLFNAIARRRTSIVEPTAGVTRDRVTTLCEIDEVYFELVDTGGHGVVDRDDLSEHVERQIQYAVDQAYLVLFVVDAREGLTPLDRSTADLLRRHAERVRLIANKVDAPHMADGIGEFIRLGFGEPLAVSAVTGQGRWELRELIKETVAGASDGSPPDPVMRIAVVGKRNAGKSTFINALAGEERVIVSETPGTTRDSIDVRFEKDGRTLVAIDTAGVRKKSKIADDIEFYAFTRATRSVRQADVVLFLIDATVPVGQVDKHLGRLIAEEYRPCILVVSKWDQAKGQASTDDYGEYLSKLLPELSYAPVAFTSAVTGRNVYSTVDLAAELFKQSQLRVGTGQLNQALQEAVAGVKPPRKRGRKALKFFYATQVSTRPPTIVVFVNGTNLVTGSYERFLLNRLRESLPFDEIPIRLVFRARRGRVPMP
jgi:GTP-binding protein